MNNNHDPETCFNCNYLSEILQNGGLTEEKLKNLNANKGVGWDGDDKGREILTDTTSYVLNPLSICPHYCNYRMIFFERDKEGIYDAIT